MRNFTASQTREYEKSNSIDRIPCLEGLDTGCKAQILNGASDAVTRTIVGQKFINEVCAKAGVPTVLLWVKDKNQLHRDDKAAGTLKQKTLGRYWHAGSNGKKIEIWNLTAKLGKVVAAKTFWNTLCHELCHHLDCAKLGLESSFHCAGFYKRISFLESLG